jgi:hypothetical protein
MTVFDIYRTDVVDVPQYEIVDFRPPGAKETIFSVISWSPVKATADFHESCPRLILKKKSLKA